MRFATYADYCTAGQAALETWSDWLLSLTLEIVVCRNAFRRAIRSPEYASSRLAAGLAPGELFRMLTDSDYLEQCRQYQLQRLRAELARRRGVKA